jgi:hypothetical protein
MTRRSLFGLLAAAALDPERLLWTPGRKLISIPAPPRMIHGHMLTVTPRFKGYSSVVDVVLDGGRNGAWVMQVCRGDSIQVAIPSERCSTRVPWLGEPISVLFAGVNV